MKISTFLRRHHSLVGMLVAVGTQQQQQQQVLFCTALSTPSGPIGGQQTSRNIATQTLQGAGVPKVDLNKYNLDSLEQIESEWTANLVQKAAEKEITLALGVKSEEVLYVDTLQVSFPRLVENPGLGIQLVELAGGRDDGLGITLVSGVVEGGPSDVEGVDIMPGDSISKITIVRQTTQQTNKRSAGGVVTESKQEFTAKTECLSYDATVDAICALPPPPSSGGASSSNDVEEFYMIQLKRLRRKPIITVNLQYPPSQGEPDTKLELFAGENLRQGMLVRGVKLNDPLAQRFDTKNGGNCGAGGLCRTCAVSILRGEGLLNPQRLAEEQMLEDTPRWRLACKAIVGFGMQDGEMTVRVNPRQWE